jgi:hypothetical protein
MTETSPKLPAQAPSQAGETLGKKSQGSQHSKDRPVTVASKDKKEAPDEEIKSEEIKQETAKRLEAKSSTQPQAAQSDVANKVPDKTASVTEDIPASYDGDEKVVPSQSSSGTTSSKLYTPVQEPDASYTSENPSVTQTTTEKPAVRHTPTEKASASHTSAEKPTVQHTPTEKLAVQDIPAEQPTIQHSLTENPGLPRTSAGKPSSQEPPLAEVHPKTTSQTAHVSDLREGKLELTVPEKVAEILPHSEHSESVDVKSVPSQTSGKVREDDAHHDMYIKQQQKEVDGSQKAQTISLEPDSNIQSAGKVPKEASLAADKSASRISETRKNDSRTSAAEHKKVTYCLILLLILVWHC